MCAELKRRQGACAALRAGVARFMCTRLLETNKYARASGELNIWWEQKCTSLRKAHQWLLMAKSTSTMNELCRRLNHDSWVGARNMCSGKAQYHARDVYIFEPYQSSASCKTCDASCWPYRLQKAGRECEAIPKQHE